MHRAEALYFIALGFICGIGSAHLYEHTLHYSTLVWLWCLVGIATFVALRHVRWALGSVAAALGVLWLQWHYVLLEQAHSGTYTLTEAQVQVVKSSIRKAQNAETIVRLEDAEIINGALYTNIALQHNKHKRYLVGETLIVTCKTEAPENHVASAFDYVRYLASRNIAQVCAYPEVHAVHRGQSLRAQIAQMRFASEDLLRTMMPSPAAGLASGLLFGGDDRLSNDVQEMFSKTGMTHIVAVSGYNVAVIAAAATTLMLWCGAYRTRAIIVAITSVVLFVIMIEFPASGVRASIMGLLVLIAGMCGRLSQSINALAIAGAVMLLYNPYFLRYDVGFQLSFLATLGLIVCYPLCERYIVQRARTFGLLEVIAMTSCAQVFVLPIIFYHFQTFSAGSLLVNLFVLPVLPVTMLLVCLGVLAAHVATVLAWPFIWSAYLLLVYEVEIITFFAEQSWNSTAVIGFELWMGALYYSALATLISIMHKKQHYA